MLVIERSVLIQADIDAVWARFSCEENLRAWFAPRIEIDTRVGGSHRHISEEGNVPITGEVLELAPPRKIALSWFEGGSDTDWVNPIRFTFTLREAADKTRVTLTIDGFETIGNRDYRRTYEAYVRGTDRHQILEALKEAVMNEHA